MKALLENKWTCFQAHKEIAPAIKGSLEWSVSSSAIQEASDSEGDSDTDSDGPDRDHWLGFL